MMTEPPPDLEAWVYPVWSAEQILESIAQELLARFLEHCPNLEELHLSHNRSHGQRTPDIPSASGCLFQKFVGSKPTTKLRCDQSNWKHFSATGHAFILSCLVLGTKPQRLLLKPARISSTGALSLISAGSSCRREGDTPLWLRTFG